MESPETEIHNGSPNLGLQHRGRRTTLFIETRSTRSTDRCDAVCWATRCFRDSWSWWIEYVSRRANSSLTAEVISLVKVWDNRWFILYAYVGHHDRVLCLSKHPFGPYIISSSLDRTIRVWSLEYGDVVDVFVPLHSLSLSRRFKLKYLLSFSIKVSEPVSHLNITRNYEKFMVMTTKCLQLWCVKHYCDFLTYIGFVPSVSDHDSL